MSSPSRNGKASDKEKAAEALREKLKEERETLSILTSPFTTTSLFLTATWSFMRSKLAAVLRSPLLWLLAVPATGLWFAAKHSLAPELFTPPVCGVKDAGVLWTVELYLREAAWWMILGVLSSIGFGTGLHSGLMFLFPHIMQVVTAAEACHTTSGLVALYQHPCKLDCATTFGPKDDSTVTFLNLWLLVTVPCMLWGVGTAAGEIPPYAVAKAARMAGKKDSEFEQEIEDAKTKTDLFSKMKLWTIDFTEKHGFLGVFLLAAWPNAAFDMCGMCCGYLLMPFWTFFFATALGKGVVKVNGQAIFFVNLFGSWFFHMLTGAIDTLNGQLASALGKDLGLKPMVVKLRTKLLQQFELQSRLLPEKLFSGRSKSHLDLNAVKSLYAKYEGGHEVAERVLAHWDSSGDGKLSLEELKEAASRTDAMVSLGSLDPGAGTSVLKQLWELVIVGLVLFFVISIVNQVARIQQAERDEAAVEKLLKGDAKPENKKEK